MFLSSWTDQLLKHAYCSKLIGAMPRLDSVMEYLLPCFMRMHHSTGTANDGRC